VNAARRQQVAQHRDGELGDTDVSNADVVAHVA
jgi:hypothetical protein